MSDYSNVERKRILAILGDNRELVSMAYGKLYTTTENSKEWLFSDLEGFLCYVYEKVESIPYLILYDSDTYDKLFQFEFYSGLHKYYKPLQDLYHCFETSNGFIMIEFTDMTSAKEFADSILKEKKSGNNPSFKKNKEEITKLLKENFKTLISDNEELYFDETFFSEEGIEILMPRHFDLLNAISYDSEKQKFIVGNLDDDIKNLFNCIGLKKKDLRNTGYALNIFKNLLQSYSNLQQMKKEKAEKLSKDGNKLFYKDVVTTKPRQKTMQIIRNPAEKIKIDNEEPDRDQIKSNPSVYISKSCMTLKQLADHKNVQTNPFILNDDVEQKTNVIPHIPKYPISNTNKMIDLSNKKPNENEQVKIDNKTTEALPKRQVNLLDQIRQGVQLRKVKTLNTERKPIKIHKQDQNFLEASLTQAIKQRYSYLSRYNNKSDEESSEDDF